jgi:hypothetical protein
MSAPAIPGAVRNQAKKTSSRAPRATIDPASRGATIHSLPGHASAQEYVKIITRSVMTTMKGDVARITGRNGET